MLNTGSVLFCCGVRKGARAVGERRKRGRGTFGLNGQEAQQLSYTLEGFLEEG